MHRISSVHRQIQEMYFCLIDSEGWIRIFKNSLKNVNNWHGFIKHVLTVCTHIHTQRHPRDLIIATYEQMEDPLY